MSNQTNKKAQNVTPIGRISFPELFEAKQINGQGDPKFGCTMVFEPDDPGLEKMRDAVQRVIDNKWNGKVPGNYKDPFIDGDESGRPEYAGKVVLRFSSKEKNRPQVVNAQKLPITDPAEVYSGCYCRISYSCYPWEYMGKKGVSFGLGHVQKVRDGGRFDGRGTADTVFDEIEDEEYEDEDMGDVPF